METFKEAKERLLRELEAAGWKVARFNANNGLPLKVPHATNSGETRVYFKAQALYIQRTYCADARFDLKFADSLFSDYRGLTLQEIARHC